MSPAWIALTTGIGLLGLMAVGFPIAFALLSVALLGYLFFIGPAALYNVASIAFSAITIDIYIAIPLFIFMAAVLDAAAFGKCLYDMMYKWMGALRGGLAIGTVAMCTIIAATTGLASTGTIIAGLLSYPEMMKRGYDKKLAIGCIPAGGTLGPIIPPSIAMIMVGTLSGQSVGKLFMAAFLPGLLMSILFMLYIAIRCFIKPNLGPPIPLAERATWKSKFISLREAVIPLLLVSAVLGSIYLGVATPTEAAGIGAVGALGCLAIYRKFSLKNLWAAVIRTFKTSGMIMWLIIGASAFASMYGITGVTHGIANLLLSLPFGPMGVLVSMLTILFILGMFLEMPAIIFICLPVMFPVSLKLGFDPVWFCFIFSVSCIIGLITPPFAISLFVFKGLGHEGVTLIDLYIAIIPYVIIMAGVIGLCVIFPSLVLWLPNMMIK